MTNKEANPFLDQSDLGIMVFGVTITESLLEEFCIAKKVRSDCPACGEGPLTSVLYAPTFDKILAATAVSRMNESGVEESKFSLVDDSFLPLFFRGCVNCGFINFHMLSRVAEWIQQREQGQEQGQGQER